MRALAVALITIGLSALAHVAAGGALPAPAGLLGIVVLAAAATFSLCRGSIARPALVPLLATAQSALHPLFSLAATLLPDGYREAFVLSTKLPEVAGETLTFPTVQTCEIGETAWVEVDAAGAEEPEHPAPAFEVTAAESEDGNGNAAAATTTAAPVSSAEVAAAASTTESGSTSWIAIAGLVAGVLGLAAGGVALARTRST